MTVKRSVKTSDLRDSRKIGRSNIYHAYRLRGMVGVDGCQFLEVLNHFVCNEMGLRKAAAAVDDPVADCRKRPRWVVLADPTGQFLECSQMVDRSYLAVEKSAPLGIGNPQTPARQPEPRRPTAHKRFAIINAIQREL